MFEGEFLRAGQDVAQMLPMLEMSGGRYRCIDKVLYIYNYTNPLTHAKDPAAESKQLRIRRMIESNPPYEPLSDKNIYALLGR